MPDPLPKELDSLGALRREIDAVDEEIHRLLMRRGEVIERLIRAKSSAETGSAFRPGREADMLRRLAGRHHGVLPLSAVEHIWREIIGTFTQLQAPFRVHATGAGEPAIRDLLRFHFGFSSPLVGHGSPEAVIAALRDSRTDLGAIPLDGADGPAWWRDLSVAPGGIKVIARLPFLSAGEPDWPRALIVGPAGIDNPDAEITVYRADSNAAERVRSGEFEFLALAPGSALIATGSVAEAVETAFEAAGAALSRLDEVGSYSAPPTR